MEDDMKRTGLIIGVIALAIMLAVPATAKDVRKEIGEAKYQIWQFKACCRLSANRIQMKV